MSLPRTQYTTLERASDIKVKLHVMQHARWDYVGKPKYILKQEKERRRSEKDLVNVDEGIVVNQTEQGWSSIR